MKPSADRSPWLLWLIVLAALAGTPAARAQTASQLYAQGVQAYDQGDVAQAKLKLQQTLQVDKNFRLASALLDRMALEQNAAAASTAVPVTRKTLDRMVVPVEFKDTTLQSALDYIRQQIDKASGGRSQMNFVLKLPPELSGKKVTLQLSHVPVTTLLNYLGELTGVTFSIEKYAVVVTPATGGASLPSSNVPIPDAAAPKP